MNSSKSGGWRADRFIKISPCSVRIRAGRSEYNDLSKPFSIVESIQSALRVHPTLVFHDVVNAGYEVVALVSGRAFLPIFWVVMIAFIASVMCAQAGSSRLLYAMGRDDAIPAIFSPLNPRFQTPDFNIAMTGAIMLIGLWIDIDTAASCINFGAFTAFAAVNFSVIYDHFAKRTLPGGKLKIVLAGLGGCAALWLLLSLQTTALAVGLTWLALGCAYLVLRSGRSMQS